MKKTDFITWLLLGAIAVSTTMTAVEIRRIARNGFEIELSDDDVKEITDTLSNADKAKRAAERGMGEKIIEEGE